LEPAGSGMRRVGWIWLAGFLFLAVWMLWDLVAALFR
jgi:hypothetical protein